MHAYAKRRRLTSPVRAELEDVKAAVLDGEEAALAVVDYHRYVLLALRRHRGRSRVGGGGGGGEGIMATAGREMMESSGIVFGR